MKRIVLAVFILLLSVTGCSMEKEDQKKMRDLEFTVVENEDLPEQLIKTIEEKKAGEFKLTYNDGNYLYILIGYGEQKTGGYSIQVNHLYLSQNAVYVDTNLIGPTKEDKISDVKTYPYIVLKVEFIDKNVVFES